MWVLYNPLPIIAVQSAIEQNIPTRQFKTIRGCSEPAHSHNGPVSITGYELFETRSNDTAGKFVEGELHTVYVYMPITGTLVIEPTNADDTVFITDTKYELYKSWTSPDKSLSYTIPANSNGNLRNTVTVNNEYLPESSESFTVSVLGATDKDNGNNTAGDTGNNNVPNTQDIDAKNITSAFTVFWTSAAMVLVLIPVIFRRKARKATDA